MAGLKKQSAYIAVDHLFPFRYVNSAFQWSLRTQRLSPQSISADLGLRCGVCSGAFVFWEVGVSQHLNPLPVFEEFPGT